MSENRFSQDAFNNAISNATTESPKRYRLEIAELQETSTPGRYEPGDFYDPFHSGMYIPAGDTRQEGAASSAFDSEQDALDLWTGTLSQRGVYAELSEGPGAIGHQQEPCYKLTDRQDKAAYVLVKIDSVKP